MNEKSTDIEKFDGRGEVAVIDDTNSPATLMRIALTQGESLEKIERMLELQEKWDGLQAKKAYTEAMANFKKNPPRIERDRTVEYQVGNKTTRYSHADLASASEKINRALSLYGLSASWKTEQDNDSIAVTCTITHKLGHSENTSLTASPDTSGSKNSIQAIGSTISYLSRYTLLALTGLAAHGQDDDGKTTSEEIDDLIDDKQLITLRDMMNSTDISVKVFLKSLKVDELKDLPAKDYKKAFSILKARATQK